MKRKDPQPLASANPGKKLCVDGASMSPCLLVRVLAQYGLLESITSHLFPPDLYSLAATSRAAYRAIFPRKESRLNLLKKMDCDGRGVRIRSRHHEKSVYFDVFQCTDVTQCGTKAADMNIKSQSCVSCGVTTCDECRIHCVYQSIFQSPDEEDELPNFSGFVLLSPHEMGILSPAHVPGLNEPEFRWGCTTHHDQGILDAPLDSNLFAVPEVIEDIINTNLGISQLNVRYSSNIPHPSPIIQAFWEVTENRKRQICEDCLREQGDTQKNLHLQCNCTLKKRFLDRWLCLKCYVAEETAQSSQDRADPTALPLCLCGKTIDEASARVTCLWCWGEVTSSPSLLHLAVGTP